MVFEGNHYNDVQQQPQSSANIILIILHLLALVVDLESLRLGSKKVVPQAVVDEAIGMLMGVYDCCMEKKESAAKDPFVLLLMSLNTCHFLGRATAALRIQHVLRVIHPLPKKEETTTKGSNSDQQQQPPPPPVHDEVVVQEQPPPPQQRRVPRVTQTSVAKIGLFETKTQP